MDLSGLISWVNSVLKTFNIDPVMSIITILFYASKLFGKNLIKLVPVLLLGLCVTLTKILFDSSIYQQFFIFSSWVMLLSLIFAIGSLFVEILALGHVGNFILAGYTLSLYNGNITSTPDLDSVIPYWCVVIMIHIISAFFYMEIKLKWPF